MNTPTASATQSRPGNCIKCIPLAHTMHGQQPFKYQGGRPSFIQSEQNFKSTTEGVYGRLIYANYIQQPLPPLLRRHVIRSHVLKPFLPCLCFLLHISIWLWVRVPLRLDDRDCGDSAHGNHHTKHLQLVAFDPDWWHCWSAFFQQRTAINLEP